MVLHGLGFDLVMFIVRRFPFSAVQMRVTIGEGEEGISLYK